MFTIAVLWYRNMILIILKANKRFPFLCVYFPSFYSTYSFFYLSAYLKIFHWVVNLFAIPNFIHVKCVILKLTDKTIYSLKFLFYTRLVSRLSTIFPGDLNLQQTNKTWRWKIQTLYFPIVLIERYHGMKLNFSSTLAQKFWMESQKSGNYLKILRVPTQISFYIEHDLEIEAFFTKRQGAPRDINCFWFVIYRKNAPHRISTKLIDDIFI